MTHSDLDPVLSSRVIPVVTLNSEAEAEILGEALVVGGLPLVEVALRTPASMDALRRISQDTRLLVGAGSVTSVSQLHDAVAAGARFIVSPGLSPMVVQHARATHIPMLPGAVSATEVMRAIELGITTVKFFPASTSGGVAAVGALSAVFREVRFVPTGGISLKELGSYLSLGSVAAVGGSWMVPSGLLESHDVQGLSKAIAATVVALRELRPE